MNATAALERITGVPGVRGALVVASDDGLLVAERVMEGLDARAVAALTGSLVGRLARTVDRAALAAPTFVQLRCADGTVLVAPAPDRLLLVAVVGAEANVGLARLEMLDAVTRLI